MQCTMTSPGLPRVQFSVAPTPTPEVSRTDTCCPGQPCRQARDAKDCLAAQAARPILDAFAAILSHEPVLLTVYGRHGAQPLEETGQRAALRLLLAALGESGCPFFVELLPAGIGRPGSGDCRAAFQRAVRGRLGRAARTDPADTPARRAKTMEARLAPLLAEARQRCRLDAGLNAVIILFNCVRLALADAEDGKTPRQGPDAVRVPRPGDRKTTPPAVPNPGCTA